MASNPLASKANYPTVILNGRELEKLHHKMWRRLQGNQKDFDNVDS